MELVDFLNLPVWRAFDIDDQGRVLAGSDASGSVQLVELNHDGSHRALTALPGNCMGRYIPGSRAVIVEHDQGGDERHQLSWLSLDPPPESPATLDQLQPLVRDPRFFHNLVDVMPGKVIYTTNRRNTVDFDVILRDLVSGQETVIYDSGGAVVEVAVSPDGERAIVVRSTAQAMSEQLLLAGRGGVSELTPAHEPGHHTIPRWVGSNLLVTTDRGRENTVAVSYDFQSQAWTELVAAAGHDVSAWPSPDGQYLLVLINDEGVARLSMHDGRSGALISYLDLPGDGWIGQPRLPEPIWSPGSAFAAISFTSPKVPGNVLVVEARTARVVTVADSTGPIGGETLSSPRGHRVPTPDGREIPCFLYPPTRSQEGAPSGSVVLHLHGGPESQAVLGFDAVIQGLAAAGHSVLVPNVRGSTGYGRSWYSADDIRLRPDSISDLATLHAWLPEVGLDQRRAALWGGSYGGYMVLAGLAFQPHLWAAGVEIVGISSLVTFLENTSPYRRAQREREYGSLEGDRDFLEAVSPLNRVAEIRAPLFVIHGANDPRVPVGEAEQLASALLARGITCELLIYQDEGHGLVRRANRLDAYPRALQFLARQLTSGIVD